MAARTLPGHGGESVTIDSCSACQAFWFDGRESLQLSPAAVLTLFRLVGEVATRPVTPFARLARCPHCFAQLVLTHDRQRNTPFEYLRCPHEHGRFTRFFDFLKEKDFVRPLSGSQLEDLRQRLSTVNCSNCGAPVELRTGSSCAHCGSALSILDLAHAEQIVGALKAADVRLGLPPDPALPLRLAAARREVDAAFAAHRDASGQTTDLVASGLAALARWLASAGTSTD
jgi:hypothetical protein